MFMYVGLFVHSAVVFHVFMFYVGLLIVRLRFMSGIVSFIDCLYCIDLFSCIATSVFNKLTYLLTGWLGSRVVSVQDSGAEGPGFKSQLRRCRVSLRQTVHTHRTSVHQAAKLVAILLRVAGVTAGLAESMKMT